MLHIEKVLGTQSTLFGLLMDYLFNSYLNILQVVLGIFKIVLSNTFSLKRYLEIRLELLKHLLIHLYNEIRAL